MKIIDAEKLESLEMDSLKICEAFKRLYGLDDVVILTREGDSLGTFSDSPDPAIRAIIEVAHKFHNKGQKRF